ncbi:hypothetical protein C4S77_08680 [Apibacter adventoris]|uniref:DNA polymerase III subunit gamma/tau n=2 Tax=Apibacter adventoris TaxID=1679466 RepID=A0A2S8A9K0_9FLAO|nr:hypothetical protein C4S77_08680 [Apibacter adventoris]
MEEKEEDLIIDSSQKSRDQFEEKDLKLFWNQYLQNLKNKQPILYNVLNTTSCQLKENFTIFFQFPSHSSYEEFESLRENFFQKLKKQLNNYSIIFNYEIKETQKNIFLSNKDKYEKMLKNNPLLEKLKNDFKLDI